MLPTATLQIDGGARRARVESSAHAHRSPTPARPAHPSVATALRDAGLVWHADRRVELLAVTGGAFSNRFVLPTQCSPKSAPNRRKTATATVREPRSAPRRRFSAPTPRHGVCDGGGVFRPLPQSADRSSVKLSLISPFHAPLFRFGSTPTSPGASSRRVPAPSPGVCRRPSLRPLKPPPSVIFVSPV